MATALHIHETLMEMHHKLPSINHNITKFNNWVQVEVAKFASRGQEASDLLTYLWKAHLVITDKKFVAYIEQLKDEDGEGRIVCTTMCLMQLVQDKYEAQEEKGTWGQLSVQQAKLVAMQVQLEKSTMCQQGSKSKGSSEGKKRKTKQDDTWKVIKPKADEVNMKQVNGKKNHCCPYHQEEGMWVVCTPKECKNKPTPPSCSQVNRTETNIKQEELPSDYEDEEE